jgi:ribosomal protein S18 acetylase RimI-like enzyme
VKTPGEVRVFKRDTSSSRSKKYDPLREYTFRKLEPRDAQDFITLRLEGLKDAPYAFIQTYEEGIGLRVHEIAGKLRSGSHYNHSFILGAFGKNEVLCGAVGLRREVGKKILHKSTLWGLYVTPSERGKGIASMLVEHVIRYVRVMKGIEVIKLSVASENFAAKGLFHRCGFQSYGVERHSLKVERRYYDEEYMLLSI